MADLATFNAASFLNYGNQNFADFASAAAFRNPSLDFNPSGHLLGNYLDLMHQPEAQALVRTALINSNNDVTLHLQTGNEMGDVGAKTVPNGNGGKDIYINVDKLGDSIQFMDQLLHELSHGGQTDPTGLLSPNESLGSYLNRQMSSERDPNMNAADIIWKYIGAKPDWYDPNSREQSIKNLMKSDAMKKETEKYKQEYQELQKTKNQKFFQKSSTDFFNDTWSLAASAALGGTMIGAMQFIARRFQAALAQFLPSGGVDPLIVDLDGNGYQLTDVSLGNLISASNDEFSRMTSWVGGNDGVLFLDRSNTNALTSLDQVFGDDFLLPNNSYAQNGFEALSSLDSNNDNVIDSLDDEFDKIKIALADGTVMTLDQANIEAIDLQTSSMNISDDHGNQQILEAIFEFQDESTGTIGDFNLATSEILSAGNVLVPVSSEIQSLPDLPGFGNVYSLHQSMARDNSGILTELISEFAQSTNYEQQELLLRKILVRWTNADSVADSAYGPHINGKTVAIISAFMGHNVINVDNPVVSSIQALTLDSVYFEIKELIYGQLMLKTHLSDLPLAVASSEGGVVSIDLSNAVEYISTTLSSSLTDGVNLLKQVARMIQGLGLRDTSNFQEFYDAFVGENSEFAWEIYSAAFDRKLLGGAGNDILMSFPDNGPVAMKGGDGDDHLASTGERTVQFGNGGNDILSGGFVSDILAGGAGDDLIYTGPGEQIIIFNEGDGVDRIIQNFPISLFSLTALGSASQQFGQGNHTDTLRFGAGIELNDVIFTAKGADLELSFEGSSDRIIIEQELSSYLYKYVSIFEFADGTSIGLDTVIEHLLHTEVDTEFAILSGRDQTIIVSNSNSTIYTGNSNSTLLLGSADYELFTGAGNSTITLGSGFAHINLGDGTNQVYLGSGNSIVEGGATRNFYYFSPSSGDTVIRRDVGVGYLSFLEGIEFSDLNFEVIDADLVISVDGSLGSIVLKEQLVDANGSFTFGFKDDPESLFSWLDLRNDFLEVIGNSGYNNIDRSAETTGEIINGLGGNDTITAGSGNDTIIITQGDQTVNGGEGDNIYIYSPGNGETIIDESSGVNAPGEADTLIFTKGIYQAGTYFAASGNDLIITFRGSSDQITVLGQNASSPTRIIETFKFSTGVELSWNDIVIASFDPTAQDQFTYKASSENDSFDFALNDGLVKIIDGRYGNDGGENDTLNFGAGIGHNDLILSSTGSSYDLRIAIDGTNDAVTITNELLTGDLKRVGLFDFDVDSDWSLAQLLDAHTVNVSSAIDDDNIDRRLSFANENIETTGENATIYAGTGDNTITDDDGDATIIAGSGNSVIDAGAGDNIIDLTNDGDATIVLGEGNNTVYDGAGNTTYQVNLGSGDSVIYQQTTDDNPGDSIIEFGADITLNDLTLQAHGLDLTLNITGGQSILLKSGLSSDLFKNISQFNFTEDSTSYSLAQLLVELPPEVIVTNDNWLEDRHFAFADETISLEGSNDRLNVGSGDVTINVSGDNNRIFAGAGDNEITIEEGALDTFINVGGGATNILIEKGTGHTTVAEFLTASFVGNNDHITLGTGIDDAGMTVTAKGYDITLHFDNTEEDQLTLQNALNIYQAKQISDITFADSTVMDLEDILNVGVTFYEVDDFRTVGDKNWTFDKTVNASGDYLKINLGEGTDILNVTGKNATVYGGAGEATVNFEDGMGSVNFYEHEVSDNNDVVSFGGELDLDDVRLTYTDSGDLILWFDGTNDIINFRDQFDSAQKEIEQFTFNDGAEVLSRSELLERTFYFTMEGDNATMYHTFDFNEEIVVNSNNAMLNLQGEGGSYDVTINGESAWMQLYGSESTITINGADAEIYAGGPSTTFVLNEGFGNLLIDEDISGASPGIDDDHIIFGEGFDVEDMILSYDQTGAALLISFEGSTDQLRINQQMYSSPFKVVEDFTFADSTVLTFADILAEGVFYFTYDDDDDADSHFGTLNENVTLNATNNHFYAADGTNTITINGDEGWVDVFSGANRTTGPAKIEW